MNLGSSLRWNDADLGVWWGISRHLPTAAPAILTSSDRFAATSSIKEEKRREIIEAGEIKRPPLP
ncbi:hypothetical protein [Maricaulis sp.]|uniref:hypothetical protein n=1 Tax=Maricaulis sp. TaxID=1486257 RepID=UPI003A90D54F